MKTTTIFLMTLVLLPLQMHASNDETDVFDENMQTLTKLLNNSSEYDRENIKKKIAHQIKERKKHRLAGDHAEIFGFPPPAAPLRIKKK